VWKEVVMAYFEELCYFPGVSEKEYKKHEAFALLGCLISDCFMTDSGTVVLFQDVGNQIPN
jgi:hypothetical protein